MYIRRQKIDNSEFTCFEPFHLFHQYQVVFTRIGQNMNSNHVVFPKEVKLHNAKYHMLCYGLLNFISERCPLNATVNA